MSQLLIRRPLIRTSIHSSSMVLSTRLFTRQITTSNDSTSQESTQSSESLPITPQLTWPEYLRLHRIQYRLGLWSSIPGSLGAFGCAAWYVSNVSIEPGSAIMGLDPMLFYMGMVVSSSIAGFLISPIIGRGLFNVIYARKYGNALQEKEREFLRRIQRNRVEPRSQSLGNPVPDYYGEKIGSLKDYKQWLRDQNAYDRKAEFGA